MLIKKAAFALGFDFSFFLFFWFFFCRSEERTCLQSLHASFPVPPSQQSISLPLRLSHLSGSGREGVEAIQAASVLMNSFQAACCRSHLLLRPGVGKRAGDVFVRWWWGGGGGEEERRQAKGPASFLRTRGAEEAPSPRSFRAPWVGSGSPTRLPAEMLARSTSPRGPSG